MNKQSPMKLLVLMKESHDGLVPMLCDEHGGVLPMQTATKLEAEVDKPAKFTVTFLVDGKDVRTAHHALFDAIERLAEAFAKAGK
jgi:hypothetical protein